MIKLINKMLNMFTQVLGLPYVAAKKIILVLYKITLQVINTLKITVILVKDSVVKILKGIWYSINKVIDIVIKSVTGIVNAVKKVTISVVKAITTVVKSIWKYLFKGIKYLPKILKAVGKWIIAAIKESIAQIFTLLGFFIAWLTLTGSAKDIVGIAILISTALWLLTIGLRKDV
tara:strand:- start:1191 stop:1715 length:525 start_codon:yes stop_codon:yes gene_type:complete